MPDQYEKTVKRNGPNRTLFVNLIGTTAAIISAISLLPQLFDVFKTKNVEGISVSTITLIFITSLLWLTYHILMGTYHGSVSAGFNMVFAAILLGMVFSIRASNGEGERLPLNE